ncbi:hypothetical protein M5689_010978 [Euphorbia peplus]|nr:hypothetical protein M5689_010978 [Euphorbia peplus]
MNFIKALNMSFWLHVTRGEFIPTNLEEGLGRVLIPPERWSQDDLRKLQTNASIINMMHCALTTTEYNKVSACETAKEVWDKLEITYEGIGKVKQLKINQHMRNYELF